MEKKCMLDGQAMKLIPAGISKKTNKPYKAFYSCKCGQTAPGEYSLPNQSSGFVKTPNFASMDALQAIERRLKAVEEIVFPD